MPTRKDLAWDRHCLFSDSTGAIISFDLAVLLVFWLGFNGFELLDDIAHWLVPPGSAEDRWSQIPRGLVFVAILQLGEQCLSLPWSIYRTFVLEDCASASRFD